MTPFNCLLCAIALSVSPAVVVGTQTAVPATLPPALRDHLETERFQIVTSIRGLPLGVRDSLQTLFGGSLDIAESGADFQAPGRAGNPKLKLRRLIAAGCSSDHCIVHYERGGSSHAWLVALFRWTPAETRIESGGIARGDLVTLDEVRNAVLANAIKGPVTAW